MLISTGIRRTAACVRPQASALNGVRIRVHLDAGAKNVDFERIFRLSAPEARA